MSSALGPSGDMGSVPKVNHSSTDSFSIEQVVVLPYGPKWFAVLIVDESTDTNEIEVSYLESTDHYKRFTWSDEL